MGTSGCQYRQTTTRNHPDIRSQKLLRRGPDASIPAASTPEADRMCASLAGSVVSKPWWKRLPWLRSRSSSIYRPTLTRRPNSDELVKEENHPHYKAERCYNISPGDVVKDGRYSIVSKLGYAGSSTVWLAEDLHEHTDARYVAINIGNRASDENRQQYLKLFQRISFADRAHRGHGLVRMPGDDFELKTETCAHLCLVYLPLRMTLNKYRKAFTDRQLPLHIVKIFTYILSHGLEYLHSSSKVIHTGNFVHY